MLAGPPLDSPKFSVCPLDGSHSNLKKDTRLMVEQTKNPNVSDFKGVVG